MKASDWIDRVKEHRGWDSDYRVAKELGLGRATVSKYRSKATTLDEEIAVKVAEALGQRAELILVDQALERAKTDQGRSALTRVLARLGGGKSRDGDGKGIGGRVSAAAAATAVALGLAAAPSPAPAATDALSSVYYVKRRRRSPLRAMADMLVMTLTPAALPRMA